jgi:hypothetical protein
MEDIFSIQNFQIRRKIFTFMGAKFHIFDNNQNLIMFSKMKAFKLKEDLRIYTDENMNEELIRISTNQIIDISATYDVYDSSTNEKIGALKRKGLKSILKDEWIIMDNSNNEIGFIKEDSTVLALLRRFLMSLIPQSYDVIIGDTKVAEYSQNFNPFVLKLNLDFSLDNNQVLNKKLGLAAGILLCAIDGRQS